MMILVGVLFEEHTVRFGVDTMQVRHYAVVHNLHILARSQQFSEEIKEAA